MLRVEILMDLNPNRLWFCQPVLGGWVCSSLLVCVELSQIQSLFFTRVNFHILGLHYPIAIFLLIHILGLLHCHLLMEPCNERGGKKGSNNFSRECFKVTGYYNEEKSVFIVKGISCGGGFADKTRWETSSCPCISERPGYPTALSAFDDLPCAMLKHNSFLWKENTFKW